VKTFILAAVGRLDEEPMRSITPVTEHDIMEATREVLATEGFVDLTLTAVAREADVAGDLLHREYDGPAGLAAAFVAYERDRLAEFLLTASDDPCARLRALLERTVGLTDPDAEALVPAYMELYARAERHEALRDALSAFDADVHAALADTVREGVEVGAFRDCDPEAVATMVVGARGAVLERRALDVDDADVRDALDDLVLSRVRAPERDCHSTTRSS
jgi:AcrR family transcriptional regulator